MRIENSITRVTVRHHEVCRVMPNSYPEWQNFQFTPNNHYGFFFLHTFPSTIAFKLEIQYALFYQFYAKTNIFFIKKYSVHLLSKTLMSKLQKMVENDVKNWCHARELSYTPSCKTTFPSRGRVHRNSGRASTQSDQSCLSAWRKLGSLATY